MNTEDNDPQKTPQPPHGDNDNDIDIDDEFIPEKSNYDKIKAEIISWIKAIVVAGLIALFVNNFIIVNALIPSGSMEPRIYPEDRVIALRLAYLFRDPQRFEIIVFKNPDDEEVLFIKRIIGLPGETVFIENGDIFIDGELLAGDDFSKDEFWGITPFGPLNIPDNSYFVLGDNRNNSGDSRFWHNPFVHEDVILGRALFKYFREFAILR